MCKKIINCVVICLSLLQFSCNKKDDKILENTQSCELEKIFNYHKQLNSSEHTFDVISWGSSSIGRYIVLYTNKQKEIYSCIDVPLNGKIEKTWLTDLDKDTIPEVVVASVSEGTGSYGELILYTFKSNILKKFDVPSLNSTQLQFYKGNDHFEIKSNKIYRSFIHHKIEDSNAQPTGDTTLIIYKFYNDLIRLEVTK